MQKELHMPVALILFFLALHLAQSIQREDNALTMLCFSNGYYYIVAQALSCM